MGVYYHLNYDTRLEIYNSIKLLHCKIKVYLPIKQNKYYVYNNIITVACRSIFPLVLFFYIMWYNVVLILYYVYIL